MFIAIVFDRYRKKGSHAGAPPGTGMTEGPGNGDSQYAILPPPRSAVESHMIPEQRSRDRLRHTGNSGSIHSVQIQQPQQAKVESLHEPDNLRRISLEDASVSSVDELEDLHEMVQVRRNPDVMQPVIHHTSFDEFQAGFDGPQCINIPIHLMEAASHRRHLSRISEELPRDVEEPPSIPPPRMMMSKFREGGETDIRQDTGNVPTNTAGMV